MYENAGSCVKLVTYLNKEIGPEKTFFSHLHDDIRLNEVIDKIDNNKRTLKKKQEKFYMLSYNPSSREIEHLVRRVTGKKVNNLSELSSLERQNVFDEFKEYVRQCMNVYAKNFNREKDIDGKDLVYFGRLEEYRRYTYEDEAVRQGLVKIGDLKQGFNLHAHVIVSRMDATQTIALSPRANNRGGTNLLNGKKVKNGFNLKKWQMDSREYFCTKYNYIPSANERFYHYNPGYSQYRNKVKNKIVNEIMEGMEEEKKLLRSVKKISNITRSPKNIIKGYLRRQVKDILFGRGQEL